MTRKFIYVYFIGGALALGLLIYDIITTWPHPDYGSVCIDAVCSLLFLYLSYKAYHEKKDSELM